MTWFRGEGLIQRFPGWDPTHQGMLDRQQLRSYPHQPAGIDSALAPITPLSTEEAQRIADATEQHLTAQQVVDRLSVGHSHHLMSSYHPVAIGRPQRRRSRINAAEWEERAWQGIADAIAMDRDDAH